MTYDDALERDMKRRTDEPIPLWDYTYQNEQKLHKALQDACTKEEAIDNLENLIDELIDTREYIKSMNDTDLA